MARINFPLSTSPGEKFVEGAGRLVNCFAEPRGQGVNPQYVIKRSPGASTFATTTETGFRGGIVVGSLFYAAFEDTVVTITSSGVVTAVGALSGTDKVFWARNSKSVTPDIVAVCDAGAFVVDSSSVTSYPDGDVGSPNAVCALDGYFFFTEGGGIIRNSSINDTAISGTDFATAESKPDGLWRPVAWNGQLFLFGTQSTEVWTGNPPNDTGFPFNRVTSIQRGLIAAHAVSGFEDGFGDMLAFVGDDNRVYRVNNYQVQSISPPELDRLIERVADKTTLEATCYKAGGHAFWQLSCDEWSWVFNVNNGKWHERQSYLIPRSRLTQASFAFNKWICGDTISGNILEITNATAMEGTNPFIARAESLPVEKFPSRIRVPRADFEFATGVGIAVGDDPVETDPQVAISWSDDGGLNWSVPLFRKLGRQAQTDQRVTILNTGLSGPNGRKWRVDMASPVHLGLMGGEQSIMLGSK